MAVVPLRPGVGAGKGALHQVDLLFACHGIKLKTGGALAPVQHHRGWKDAFRIVAPQSYLHLVSYGQRYAFRQLQAHTGHGKVDTHGP